MKKFILLIVITSGLLACRKDDIKKVKVTNQLIEKASANILITEKNSSGVADSSVVDGDEPPIKKRTLETGKLKL